MGVLLAVLLAATAYSAPQPPPESAQVGDFISARFPANDCSISTEWNNKVSLLNCPSMLQTDFDQLVIDLTAAFPDAMSPENEASVPFHISDGAAQVWSAMPAAITELRGLTVFRAPAFLMAKKQAQLVANVQTVGVAGSGLRAQASLDNGATWRALAATGTGPELSIAAAGVIKSAIVDLDVAVRKDVLIRIVGGGGNGVASPAFGTILLRVR